VGRRHLSRLLPAVITLAAVASAAAASAIPFRVAAHSVAPGATSARPFALVATSTSAAHRIAVHLPPKTAQVVLRANYRTSFAVGAFGPFGGKDGRVHVARVTQSGRMMTVHLSIKPLPPGTMECLAIYETARVLLIPRAALHGAPATAAVTVAGS
jgi:hypothetical protein